MTNKQYKTWKRMIKYYLLAGFMLGIMIGCYFWPPFASFAMADPSPSVILSHTEGVKPTIEDEIREVFGIHTKKALLLLKGKGGKSCAENRSLDPNAVNRNWIKGNPGKYWSSDWGVFQINDYYHKIYNTKLLTDPKINIRIAWKIFEDSGHKFSAWTCGKVYGI